MPFCYTHTFALRVQSMSPPHSLARGDTLYAVMLQMIKLLRSGKNSSGINAELCCGLVTAFNSWKYRLRSEQRLECQHSLPIPSLPAAPPACLAACLKFYSSPASLHSSAAAYCYLICTSQKNWIVLIKIRTPVLYVVCKACLQCKLSPASLPAFSSCPMTISQIVSALLHTLFFSNP